MQRYARSSAVLIETYWNVKYKYSYDGERTLTVLIETYWNVKRVRSHQSDHEASINRNILECKGWSLTAS